MIAEQAFRVRLSAAEGDCSSRSARVLPTLVRDSN